MTLAFPKDRRAPRPKKRIARGKRPNPMSKKNLPKLKRKLWNLFAAYVKERDGDTCFSCGRGCEGSGRHAGHMFPSVSSSILRYHPKNVHTQCFNCNINLGGNGAAYAARFIDTYSYEEYRRMESMKSRERQWQPVEIMELIEALQRGGADFECLYEEKYGLDRSEGVGAAQPSASGSGASGGPAVRLSGSAASGTTAPSLVSECPRGLTHDDTESQGYCICER